MARIDICAHPGCSNAPVVIIGAEGYCQVHSQFRIENRTEFIPVSQHPSRRNVTVPLRWVPPTTFAPRLPLKVVEPKPKEPEVPFHLRVLYKPEGMVAPCASLSCNLGGAVQVNGRDYCVLHAFQNDPETVLNLSEAKRVYLAGPEIGGGWLDFQILEMKRRELENQAAAAKGQPERRVCENLKCDHGADGGRASVKPMARFCSANCRKQAFRRRRRANLASEGRLKPVGRPRKHADPRKQAARRVYKTTWQRNKRRAVAEAAREAEPKLTPNQLRLQNELRSRRRSMAARANRGAPPAGGWPRKGEPHSWTEPAEQELIERDLRSTDPLADEEGTEE